MSYLPKEGRTIVKSDEVALEHGSTIIFKMTDIEKKIMKNAGWEESHGCWSYYYFNGNDWDYTCYPGINRKKED
jgi:hypothetical protein